MVKDCQSVPKESQWLCRVHVVTLVKVLQTSYPTSTVLFRCVCDRPIRNYMNYKICMKTSLRISL